MSETKNAKRGKRENVNQTPDGRWRYRVMGTYADGTKERISGCAPKDRNTKTAAREAMQAHLARMRLESPPTEEDVRNDNHAPAIAEGAPNHGHPTPAAAAKPAMPTVSEFKPIYMAKCVADNKEITVETKETAFLHIERLVGDVPVDHFDYAKTETFRQGLLKTKNSCVKYEERTLGVTTVNNVLKVFRNMINMAAEWYGFPAPKVPYAKRPKEEELDFDFLTFEEFPGFVEAAGWCPRHQAMVIVAADTGMRRGELLGLHRDRVNLAGREAYVCDNYVKGRKGKGRMGLPKNKKPRTVQLTEAACTALAAVMASHPHGRVFCDERGAILDPSKMTRDLYKTCKRARLGRTFGWHVLRHTFASHLVMKGLPLPVLQKMMDHADIKTTMIYAHVARGASRDAVKLLDARPSAPAATGEMARVWQKNSATPLAA